MYPSKLPLQNLPVVVDTRCSPHACLQPTPLSSVILEDNFWRERQRVNMQTMLPAQYRLCEDTGRIDNFRRASGRKKIDFQGWFFNDSDVYKWIEASAWILAANATPELEALIDRVIEEIAAAQRPDGYLNTYFTFERAQQRWTNFDYHEMYCAGHLIQAAVAHYRVTHKTNLLEVARRFADHICDWFGPEEQGKHFGADGHPEIEMALVELYRLTGEQKYLEQAQYFLAVRGSGKLGDAFHRNDPGYHQDHLPFQESTRLVGHAVRAIYLNCGAADLAAETGDPALGAALSRMWQNMTSRQMYVHGGLGSRYENEGFGQDYELPNSRAHAETCASIANFMWNWRMLLMDADARYADVMELALYNSILSGVSLDGSSYFYQNPLLDDGSHRRQQWFTVSCCPSNLSRLLASLSSYLYSSTADGVWVHLYASSRAGILLPGGGEARLVQRTDYPWSDVVEIEVQTPANFSLYLRLPGWCGSNWLVLLNGKPVEFTVTQGRYLKIEREWQVGDVVKLHLPMQIRYLENHSNVVENQGRVALMRGPLLYCVEGVDHPSEDVRHFVLTNDISFSAEFVPDLLGGVTVLRGAARVAPQDENWGEALYRQRQLPADRRAGRKVSVMAIPYYAWANRAPGPMLVWLRGE